ncbi:hypothetical protein RJ641_007046 [Dillenia turbinata]|uniref:C2H2-type domain-containing protein n=1 Tax=Dillenia turbinata TaxID=194707 RepID=A0AAN8ZAP6_9MAGN
MRCRLKSLTWVSFLLLLPLLSVVTVSSSNSHEGVQEPETGRTLKQEQTHFHEVHCSRERSRAARKAIEEYLMPFVEKERYKLSTKCRLHPDNDLFRDQEQHKIHVDFNEWQCGYCKKRFYAEKYLDKHFDNRHYNLLNTNGSKCLADLCGALHCDLVMDSQPRKAKCNPAAAMRNRHLCESLADNCFPASESPSAGRLREFFLRQFCDAHTCSGGPKPFSKGKRVMLIITWENGSAFISSSGLAPEKNWTVESWDIQNNICLLIQSLDFSTTG